MTAQARRRLAAALLAFGRAGADLCAAGAAAINEGEDREEPSAVAVPPPPAPRARRRTVRPPRPDEPVSELDRARARQRLGR